MIVDFKEIPAATPGAPYQDQFELFARDFLSAIGFAIIDQPDRGQDGGRDLLIKESLVGIRLSGERKWILSAKHFAPSGRSVGINDEQNIRDRVEAARSDGFLGFYSTLPSSGLTKTFRGLGDKVLIDYLDRGLIEQYLITDPRLESVLRAYFPRSYLHFESIGGYPATTKDLHTFFIGGDAFPLIVYGINSQGSVLPTVYNRGCFTLYDLDVIISHTPGRGGPFIKRTTFSFLHPGSNVYCESFNVNKVIADGCIHSQIYARNGIFFQSTEILKYRNEATGDVTLIGGNTRIYRENHNSPNRNLVYKAESAESYSVDDIRRVRVHDEAPHTA